MEGCLAKEARRLPAKTSPPFQMLDGEFNLRPKFITGLPDIPELRLHSIIFFAFVPKNPNHDHHRILEIRDLSMYFLPDFNRHFCNTVEQETDPFQRWPLRRFSFLIRNELARLPEPFSDCH